MTEKLLALLATLAAFAAGAFALFKKGEAIGEQNVRSEANTEALKAIEESREIKNDVDEVIADGSLDDRLDQL